MGNAALRRNFEALEVEKKQKQARLTPKQYLVYSYLMSISKWNAQTKETHYYVYKNSFKIKDACEAIGISQPTWRSAIAKLEQEQYIKDMGEYYKIRLKEPYAPLHIDLIKTLLPYGKELSAIHKQGGNIIAVYSLLYRYWIGCQGNRSDCKITVNQIKAIFKSERTDITTRVYKMMLGIFEAYDLINMTIHYQAAPDGKPYPIYTIYNVKLELPKGMENEEIGDSEINHILDTIKANLDEFGEPIKY